MAEIKMNNKKSVIDNFKDIVNAQGNQDMEQFIQIMEMPDKDFDNIFPMMRDKLTEVYSNPAYEAEVRENLKMELRRNPDFNIEEQAAAAREFIKTLEEEDMSKNKKEFLQLVLENAVLKFVEIYDNPREKIRVKIQKINEDAVIPTYAYSSDAGADVSSVEEVTLAGGETKIIKTGFKVNVPKGYALLIYPRSGMSLKTKIRIANCVGVVDPLYHKEVGVIVDNIGTEPYTIHKGDRIAQFILTPIPMIDFVEDQVEDNERGGFGSTGI